jgi:hypothetical protein
VRLAVALAASVLLAAFLGACSGLSEGGPNVITDQRDRRVSAIAGAASGVISNWSSLGPQGIYNNMAPEVRVICSEEEFVQDLSDVDQRMVYLRLNSITLNDAGDVALANISIRTVDGDVEVDWLFKQDFGGGWRPIHVPGMNRCRVGDVDVPEV